MGLCVGFSSGNWKVIPDFASLLFDRVFAIEFIDPSLHKRKIFTEIRINLFGMRSFFSLWGYGMTLLCEFRSPLYWF